MSGRSTVRDHDLRAVVRLALAAGCTLEALGRCNGHLRLRTPGGVRITLSSSPSDGNAYHNVLAALRRAGVPLPAR